MMIRVMIHEMEVVVASVENRLEQRYQKSLDWF
jgi:hypothetical protein